MAPITNLSARQRQIAWLVAQGYRNREIASQLQLTEGTVKVYLTYVFKKLNITNRTQLVTLVLTRGVAQKTEAAS